MGTNSNPSRKEFSGALRPNELNTSNTYPTPTTGSLGSHQALLERRCVFLEGQDKRKSAEIADLRARLSESAPLTESVTGTVLRDTWQVHDVNDAPATREEVTKGSKVTLFYPMKQVRTSDGESQVWMRRREVCAVLATISYKWVLIFNEREVDGVTADSVFVGNFA